MKNILLVLAGILIGVVVLGVAGFAYAQVQDPSGAQFLQGYGPGMMGGYGRGMMGSGGYGPMHTYMVDAFASALGMTSEELQAKIEAGETMWQIAQAQGLSDEEISALMLGARSDALQKAVEAGALTQEQAEWMTAHMQQSGMTPGFCHGAGGGQRGAGWRWNNTPEN